MKYHDAVDTIRRWVLTPSNHTYIYTCTCTFYLLFTYMHDAYSECCSKKYHMYSHVYVDITISLFPRPSPSLFPPLKAWERGCMYVTFCITRIHVHFVHEHHCSWWEDGGLGTRVITLFSVFSIQKETRSHQPETAGLLRALQTS